MGLPSINDFIKAFKEILFNRGIITPVNTITTTNTNITSNTNTTNNTNDQNTNEQNNQQFDIIIIDVSAIIFKYMIGQYLLKSQHRIQKSIDDIEVDDNIDDIDNDDNIDNDIDNVNNNSSLNHELTMIPSIKQCIDKLNSYKQFVKDNEANTNIGSQLFVFDPIHSKSYQQYSDENINKDFIDHFIKDLTQDEKINKVSSKIKQLIDFNKLTTIKEQTWQQRDKSKYQDVANEIKRRITQLYLQLRNQSTSNETSKQYFILSKYETDIMIGSLYQRLSPKYNILTITEDSDMLIHSFPGQVYLPHIGIVNTKKFWELFNLTTKAQLSTIPYHYGCDYQIKNISLISKQSFTFLSSRQQQQGQQQSIQQQLISITFQYEQYIEDDYKQNITPINK